MIDSIRLVIVNLDGKDTIELEQETYIDEKGAFRIRGLEEYKGEIIEWSSPYMDIDKLAAFLESALKQVQRINDN